MDDFEEHVIQCALDWAEYRHARDHLGQPTESMAKEALEKLFDACSKLQAESEGQWRASSERERWLAFAEKYVKEAEERFIYFDSGPGWRTHCAGARGAEEAALYWRRRLNVWGNVRDTIKAARE